MADLKILTYNVQGIGGIGKRTDIFEFLKNMDFDIYCLQETHFTDNEEILIRTHWNNDCYFSNYKSNAQGVAILFNKNVDYKMHSQIVSDNGNFILLDMTVHNQRFTLVNLYGPNADNPNFYLEIFKKIEEIGNTEFIICGDFNLILDPEKDCTNYKNVNNPRAREKLLEFIESNNLTDPFRENHPEVKWYSWRKRNPLKQARLDFFLTSEIITQFVQQSKIESSYRSDHSLVTLFLNLTGLKHGKSYWKHNNSLLLDQEYLKTMNKKLQT